MRPVLLVAAVFWLALAGCGKSPSPEVIILHSGRMRGNVYPLSLQGIAPLQHYPYLAGYIRKVRAEAGRTGARVFVVDLGDSMDGSFAAHVTGSQNMTAFFNAAGYDAILLSNLDARVPAKALEGLHAKVLSPFETASGGGFPAAQKFDKEGVGIFLLSNFYGETTVEEQPGRFPTRFGADRQSVRPVRDYAKAIAGVGPRDPGALTLFSWMKFEPSSEPPSGFLSRLRSHQVDAILAHRIYSRDEREAWDSSGFADWAPPASVNILRNNGGFALARIDLARKGGGAWTVLRHEVLPMTANVAEADPDVVSVIEKFAGEISKADQPVLSLPEPVGAGDVLNIYLGALTTLPGTQAVAYSPESIRAGWEPGLLRASALFESLPWTDALVQILVEKSSLASLNGLGGLRVAVLDSAGDGPLRLTTSRFFADLILGQPALAGAKVAGEPAPSEFDFFRSHLEALGELPAPALPPGWSLLP